jgi:hypothetical protein
MAATYEGASLADVLLTAKVALGKDLLVGIVFLGKTEAWEEGGEPARTRVTANRWSWPSRLPH